MFVIIIPIHRNLCTRRFLGQGNPRGLLVISRCLDRNPAVGMEDYTELGYVVERRIDMRKPNFFIIGEIFDFIDREGLPCKLKIEDAGKYTYKISLDGKKQISWFTEEYLSELKMQFGINCH